MYRLFNEHNIRRVHEADGLWDFCTADGAYIGKMAVPSCWESVPALSAYRGKATYTKRMTLGGNVRLVFKGVSHTAKVYVNGDPVCEHYNAYTEFHTDLSLPHGEHEICIEVDNSYSGESALHVENDYYTYGGIIRPIIIEELSDAVINHVHFTPKREGKRWTARAVAEVESRSDKDVSYTLSLSIGGVVTDKTVHLDARKTVSVEFDLSFDQITSYTSDEPKLYPLSLVLYNGDTAVDDLIDRVGFREIGVDGRRILLNGEPILLRGFNRHEDYNSLGSSVPLQAMMRDLGLIREAGANCIRTSHYPNDELFLDLCDEMGILVWEEGHARGLSEKQMSNPCFISQSLNCIDEMITSHYNHPSVFCWGILNECSSDTEYGRECYKALFDRIAARDTSRPKTFASNKNLGDICFDLCDIVSVNMYPGWYNFADLDRADKHIAKLMKHADESAGVKPFIISEIGAGGIYGFRSDSACKWSEEGQAQILDTQLTEALSNDDVCGVFVWQFCDVRVDESWFSSRPRCMNNKGIVDEYRRKKLAYDVVKRHFSENDEKCHTPPN